jgi:hypothetical protein
MLVKKTAPMVRPTSTMATSRTVVRPERRFSFGEAVVVMASSSEVCGAGFLRSRPSKEWTGAVGGSDREGG